VRSPHIETLRELASAGVGIAYVPDPVEVAPHVGKDELVRVLPEVIGQELSIWILMPTPRMGAGRTRAVLEITKGLRDWLAQHPAERPDE
jgi:DNA-binding transcriptional LysR family regulator